MVVAYDPKTRNAEAKNSDFFIKYSSCPKLTGLCAQRASIRITSEFESAPIRATIITNVNRFGEKSIINYRLDINQKAIFLDMRLLKPAAKFENPRSAI